MVCGLTCWGKQLSQELYTFQQKRRVCIREKLVSLNSTGHNHDVSFFVTLTVFSYGKDCIMDPFWPLILCSLSPCLARWALFGSFVPACITVPHAAVVIYYIIYKIYNIDGSIWKPFNNVLDKQKIVLKTHLFSKTFCFLYRSFVSLLNKCVFKTIWYKIAIQP